MSASVLRCGAPVLFDLLTFNGLLFVRQDVLFAHADLEALHEATTLAEPTIRDVHLTLLVVRTLKVVLHKN